MYKEKANLAANGEREQDEASILAAIGSSLQESNAYETQVLRAATQSSAPKLSGLGFPNLASLAPSHDPSKPADMVIANGNARGAISNKRQKIKSHVPPQDIPHILKVLSNVRSSLQEIETSSKLSESRQAQVLRIKHQMLLTYLATHTNLSRDEVGIDITQEVRGEERRKGFLLRQNAKEHSRSGQKPRSKSSLMVTDYNHDRSAARRKNPFSRSTKDGTQRLEQIKRGETTEENVNVKDDNEGEIEILSKSKMASFGKQALEARNASIANAKRKGSSKKMSMMGLKRKLVEDEGETWVDPEELYKRRLARLERRRVRRGGVAGAGRTKVQTEGNDDADDPNGNGASALSDKVDVSSFQIRNGGGENKVDLTESTSECQAQRQSSMEPKNDVISSESQCPERTVHCAVCNETIRLPEDYIGDVDSFLSKHMHECQTITNERNTRSRLALTRRSRRSTSKPVTYKEDDDDDDIDYYKKMSNKQRRRIVKGFVDDEDVGDVESSGDEPLVGMEKENKELGDEKEKLSDSGKIEIQSVRNMPIDDFDEDAYEDRVDDWIENGIDGMKVMAEQDDSDERPGAATYPGGLRIPAWINDRLFGYQRTALRWMWELHLQEAGGVVGDEMGLGKTVQVCSYLGALVASRKLRSVLVIAPATMLSHWLRELSKWAPGLRRILMHKSGERGGEINSRNISRRLLGSLEKWLNRARSDRLYEPIDEKDLLEFGPDSFCGTGYVILATFESIRRCSEIWVGHKWSYIIMDEGQKIRNPDAEVTIACKRLRTPHRLLLSGTPIQNDLRELWSLFDFVFPGRLGTLPVFLSEFADPIRRGGYSNATPMQVQLAYRCALVLRDLINPYLLRRQKKDIKEVSRMPGKTEQVLFCNLSKRQRSMYEAYLASDEVRNMIRGSAQCFKPIITLRKICNHPDLICSPHGGDYESFIQNGYVNENDLADISSDEDDFGMENYDESTLVDRSGKFEVLAKILPLWKKQGHRVLIFSQWKKMLDIISHFMNSQGYKFGRLDGNTNVSSRQRLVDAFNNDDSYFGMLLTTKTGGVGLNLTGANRIILYDPDWNPQSDAQARERAWRFGQEKAVTVYRLITAGTIEEKIYQRQIFKTALSNQVLQDPRQRRLFSQKTLRDLFTLKADVDSVSRGGDGITETGELTKGRGVIEVDDADKEDKVEDNNETMEEVLKSKGLAGIFDHDVVDKPFAKKSQTVREMEKDARRVASRAAKALAKSLDEAGGDGFIPTWTGSNETESRRFGGVSRINNDSNSGMLGMKRKKTFESQFGGAKSSGLGIGSGAVSSNALLAQVRERRKEIASGGTATENDNPDQDDFAVTLMKRIRTYIKRFMNKSGKGPSTKQILSEFKDVKNSEAALFKSILKQVAIASSGQWVLR